MPVYPYRGRWPTLGARVFLAPGAHVVGDVTLGDDVSFWFHTAARGDVNFIRIGARTNVQDGCMVHVTGERSATSLGDDVTVGHKVLLHGCTVGSRCLIGMGSILLDDVVVGDECIVGAGSLLTPRTVVPPRSLVLGRPARVVRPVRDEDVAAILESSALYVQYAREYREGALRLVD